MAGPEACYCQSGIVIVLSDNGAPICTLEMLHHVTADITMPSTTSQGTVPAPGADGGLLDGTVVASAGVFWLDELIQRLPIDSGQHTP